MGHVTKDFQVIFKEKLIRALPAPTYTVIEFKCYLQSYDAKCEIADVQIKGKQ